MTARRWPSRSWQLEAALSEPVLQPCSEIVQPAAQCTLCSLSSEVISWCMSAGFSDRAAPCSGIGVQVRILQVCEPQRLPWGCCTLQLFCCEKSHLCERLQLAKASG